MSKIKLHGTPTKHTPGAIGDIYIDLDTGLEYRCTFAYRDPFFDAVECQWKLTGTKHPVRGLRTDVPVVDDVVPEDVKEELVEAVEEEKSKYVNYSKHSKKAK